jgi:hypothetical protein
MNNLKDIQLKSKQLKSDAEEILLKGKVVEILKPFGEVVLRGSFALDLMVVEDIDLSVINPDVGYKRSDL